jgi:predicted nucleic acid-binding protein
MTTEGRVDAILDTSTLINFLRIDRLDLLSAHPKYNFVVTNHVRLEVTEHYYDQFAALDRALLDGQLVETEVNSIEELVTFADLSDQKNLGAGECAAIAAAFHRGMHLAIDDKRAAKEAMRLAPTMILVSTTSIILDLLRSTALNVKQADRIKADWEISHRFRLPFNSFATLLHDEQV